MHIRNMNKKKYFHFLILFSKHKYLRIKIKKYFVYLKLAKMKADIYEKIRNKLQATAPYS